MPHETSSPIPSRAELAYVVGIDIGMESSMMCCLTMDKRQVIKPSKFSNEADGFEWLFEHLDRLKTSADQILIGLEATSRYGENLHHALLKRGYRLCLLHPGQIHAFAQQRGLRAKTDCLDAATIARALLSGEARFGYIPRALSELKQHLGMGSDFCYLSPRKRLRREVENHEMSLLYGLDNQKASEENRTWLYHLLLLSVPTYLQ